MKVHHICIQTNNYEESKKFYSEILGFKLLNETKNFHGREYNSWLELNGFYIELQTGKEELNTISKESQGIAHFALLSEDIIKDLEKIKSNGYNNFKLKNGKEIYEVMNGKIFKLIAPEGTIIEVRDNPLF